MTDRSASLRAAGAALAGVVLRLLLGAVAAVLAFAIWSLPSARDGLGDDVLGRLHESGVESPVTAVLMNFRGYDTLLELAVLFVALLGVWSLGRMPHLARTPLPAVQRAFTAVLVPFLTLFAAYLLWAGTQAAGGAFQAGVVAAGAGVLVALAGERSLSRLPQLQLRVLLALGLLAFVAVALGTLAAGGAVLEYPQPYVKGLILLVEAAAAVSIGLALLAVFLGGTPPPYRSGTGGA